MSIDALRVALQGVGFPLTPIALAVQGFIEESSRKHLHQDTDQGRAGKQKPPERDYLSENLLKQQKARDAVRAAEYNRNRIAQEDLQVSEFLLALVQMEFLDGTI